MGRGNARLYNLISIIFLLLSIAAIVVFVLLLAGG